MSISQRLPILLILLVASACSATRESQTQESDSGAISTDLPLEEAATAEPAQVAAPDEGPAPAPVLDEGLVGSSALDLPMQDDSGGDSGAAAAPQHAVAQRLQARTLAEGVQCALPETCTVVCTSEAQWRRLWSDLNANVIPEPELPVVDWGKEMVIGVAIGQRNSGGYGVRIDSVFLDGGRMLVTATETRPEPGQLQTMALTAPFQLVVTQLYQGPAEFRIK